MTAPKTVLEVLIAARELISVPKRWTQHTFALDAHGDESEPNEPGAVCWCALGAIRHVCGESSRADWSLLALSADDALEVVLPRHVDGIDAFNDDAATQHADVIAAFDRAIAAERGRGAS